MTASAEQPSPQRCDDWQNDESFAQRLDLDDPLCAFRDQFHLPVDAERSPLVYFAGNSLGLQPKQVRARIEQELSDWARYGVHGHFKGQTPWYNYADVLKESAAGLVGAHADEVVMMNSLTVNLHLMMVTFYRPTGTRYKIVMEDAAFPSDTYAVKTQLAHHGIDAADGLIVVKPRDGEHTLRTEDFEGLLRDRGDEIAMVLLGGVNYYTGQVFEMDRICAAAKARGCVVGLDLAHAVGNVPLSLHDWAVDFAVWCSYKYLNAGPGAVAGCFVHNAHSRDTTLQRFGGWWGNDPATRFRMHLQPEFVPRSTADGWQVSNPPILSLAPLQVSLAMFEQATPAALRAKSIRLTGYLQFLLDEMSTGRIEIITPRDTNARGCQLSLLVSGCSADRLAALEGCGVVCDVREPDVVRVAPTPLYNTFHDVWRFADVLSRQL